MTIVTARGDQEPWSVSLTVICFHIFEYLWKSFNIFASSYLNILFNVLFEYILGHDEWRSFISKNKTNLSCFRFSTVADKAQKCCPSLVSLISLTICHVAKFDHALFQFVLDEQLWIHSLNQSLHCRETGWHRQGLVCLWDRRSVILIQYSGYIALTLYWW